MIAATAALPIRLATTGLDFYMHDTYFVVPPRYSFFGFALLCFVIAFFYYFGDRASGNRFNNGLTLAHFLLWILAVLISFAVEFMLVRAVLGGHAPNESRLILAGSVAIPAFLIGGVLFLVNFALAMVRKVRAS